MFRVRLEQTDALRPTLRRILWAAMILLSASAVTFAALQSTVGAVKAAAGCTLCAAMLRVLRRRGVRPTGLGVCLIITLLVLDSGLRYGVNAMPLPALLLVPMLALLTHGRRASVAWGVVAFAVLGAAVLAPAAPLGSLALRQAATLINVGTVLILMGVLMSAYDQSMRRQRQQLLAAEDVKNTFLATISHELRTPLHGMLGSAELLDGEDAALDRPALLAQLQGSGQSLLGLVDDLLLLSQLQGASMPVHPQPTPLRALLLEALAPAQADAARKGLRAQADLGELPAVVTLDPVGLSNTLRHLLSNAVKFTERGTIWLHARHDGAELQVEVRDSGIGIAPDEIQRIFRFAQADGGMRRRYEGSGLGLTLSTHLITAMGGTLQAESRPGVGSTFRVRVPAPPRRVQPPAPARAPAPAPRGDQPFTILVAEDNLINQALVQAMLRGAGFEVVVALDGAEATAKAPRADLILMDCHMPETDGIEATRRIRAAGHQLPILALTADALVTTRERCMAVGMDAVLYKPVQRQKLIGAVRRHLPQQQSRSA